MNYTVRLAIFPAWKAPIPSEVIGSFMTIEEATVAGRRALLSIMEHELSSLGDLNAVSKEIEGRLVTAIDVPEGSVSGYLIYNADDVEIGNFTTLDIAVERAALKSS
jgi:hypothetical protein